MSLKPIFATPTTLLSTELDSLAGGSSASSAEQNNGSDRYLDAQIDVELASASADTGYCSVYLLEGSETGKLSTTANVSMMRYLMDVQMNGTTAVRKSRRVLDLPKFYKVHVIKNAAPALAASGNTVKVTGVNVENV